MTEARQIEMKLYEITLDGFAGGDDATDDLVVWIAAPDGKIVENAIEGLGAKFCGEVSAELEMADFSLPRDAQMLHKHILDAKIGVEAAPSLKM